jgi:predicted aspartyl protease
VSDDQAMRALYLMALLMLLLPAVLPIARSQRQWLRNAAIWVFIGACLLAGYQVVAWLVG